MSKVRRLQILIYRTFQITEKTWNNRKKTQKYQNGLFCEGWNLPNF